MNLTCGQDDPFRVLEKSRKHVVNRFYHCYQLPEIQREVLSK